MDTFPDLGSLSDQELKDLIKQLTEEEMEISYKRRILHGKIDILRAELVNRLRKKDESGELVISGADVQQLTDILAGRVPAPRRVGPSVAVAQHCPECGFANAEGANYCQRCGAFLGGGDAAGATTATYRVGETGELEVVELEDVVRPRGRAGYPAPVAAGPGRAFRSKATAFRVGRRPDCDIFLDDVTVSRDHAILVRRAGDYYLDDCGSLNGTYVNRRRIESHRLTDGDELQIGSTSSPSSKMENLASKCGKDMGNWNRAPSLAILSTSLCRG